MKTRFFALMLAVVMLLSVTLAASAVTIPNAKDTGLMDMLPEIPTMTTKNDGKTQTVTLSSPMTWLAAIWNWEWVQMTFTDSTNTKAEVDMTGYAGQQGLGLYAGVWYTTDEEGNEVVGGHYSGVYEMPYAYDGGTPDGTNVKFDRFGNPALVTVETAGTSYFGNGDSAKTTVTYKYDVNSYGQRVFYVDELKEEYPDGSYIHGRFSMNGNANYVYAIGADGTHTVLQGGPPTLPAGEEEGEGEESKTIVIFEGSASATNDWSGTWQNDHIALDMSGEAALKQLQPGDKLVVTYTSNWNPCILLIQPSAGEKQWNWGQIDNPDSTATTDDGKQAIYTYDTIISKTGDLSTAEFALFNLYGNGEELTVTKVEIVPAE